MAENKTSKNEPDKEKELRRAEELVKEIGQGSVKRAILYLAKIISKMPDRDAYELRQKLRQITRRLR